MNECCSGDHTFGQYPNKYRCPVNGKVYSQVKMNTLMQHIIKPWDMRLINQGYYFCEDPDCDVVYFGQNDLVISKYQVRTPIWQKESKQDSEVCYCFGATHKQAEENGNISKFIQEQTKNGLCSCETRNPSGRCCLKDFPKNQSKNDPH